MGIQRLKQQVNEKAGKPMLATANISNVVGVNFYTILDITGEGYLDFVTFFDGDTGYSDKQIRITVDGAQSLITPYQNINTSWGSLLRNPSSQSGTALLYNNRIKFNNSLKVEVKPSNNSYIYAAVCYSLSF